MPTWFPNIRLQMMALSQEQRTSLLETGWLREVAFKTEPRVNKVGHSGGCRGAGSLAGWSTRQHTLWCTRPAAAAAARAGQDASRRHTCRRHNARCAATSCHVPPHLSTPTTRVPLLLTTPQVEIKAFLEAVYGMQVERVNTINYQV
jgi:hypothetical protein